MLFGVINLLLFKIKTWNNLLKSLGDKQALVRKLCICFSKILTHANTKQYFSYFLTKVFTNLKSKNFSKFAYYFLKIILDYFDHKKY